VKTALGSVVKKTFHGDCGAADIVSPEKIG